MKNIKKMTEEDKDRIRNILIRDLSDYKGEEAIDLSNCGLIPSFLEQIIFKDFVDENGGHYKEFAIDEKTLKCIKLNNVSFADFNFQSKSELVHDFTGYTGIEINPLESYKGDLSNCIFDENITFTGSFDNCNICGITIANCKNAKINPQTILRKRLYGCNLKGVEFTGSFDDCDFGCTTIEKCKNAKINPQTILGKRLYGCKLKDVEFIGSFDNCFLSRTAIANCENVIINPQTIVACGLKRGGHGCISFFNCSLSDAIINGTFKDMSIEGLNLNNCDLKGEVSNNPDIFENSYLTKVNISNCQNLKLNPTKIGSLNNSSINDAKLCISNIEECNNVESTINGLTYDEYCKLTNNKSVPVMKLKLK